MAPSRALSVRKGGGESGPNGIDIELTVRTGTEKRLDRGQRQRGVVGLMFPM